MFEAAPTQRIEMPESWGTYKDRFPGAAEWLRSEGEFGIRYFGAYMVPKEDDPTGRYDTTPLAFTAYKNVNGEFRIRILIKRGQKIVYSQLAGSVRYQDSDEAFEWYFPVLDVEGKIHYELDWQLVKHHTDNFHSLYAMNNVLLLRQARKALWNSYRVLFGKPSSGLTELYLVGEKHNVAAYRRDDELLVHVRHCFDLKNSVFSEEGPRNILNVTLEAGITNPSETLESIMADVKAQQRAAVVANEDRCLELIRQHNEINLRLYREGVPDAVDPAIQPAPPL